MNTIIHNQLQLLNNIHNYKINKMFIKELSKLICYKYYDKNNGKLNNNIDDKIKNLIEKFITIDEKKYSIYNVLL